MGLTAFTSVASRHRIARGRDWLNARRPAEEVLIIGATLGAGNELTRGLAQEKRASFGYHRLTSALARPALSAQRNVPLGALGILAVANRRFIHCPRLVRLAVMRTLRAGPDSLVQ